MKKECPGKMSMKIYNKLMKEEMSYSIRQFHEHIKKKLKSIARE
jgi:hypothetical protein